MLLVVLIPSVKSIGFRNIKSSSSGGIDELIVGSGDVFNLMNLSKNRGLGFISVMRNFDSSEGVSSGDRVFFSFSSQNNGGVDDSLMVNDGFDVLFGSSFFGGNESSSFRGNISEHTSVDFSFTRLGFIDPSVDTSSRTDGIFFVSGHTS